jgi:4-amino-4-deoxy-L-arabinose transferase-like glycosyltransferase
MLKRFQITALIILFFLWILPGLAGRDPWKSDEPYTFGMVNHIITSGDWVVPTLAGEPFLEKPPLYFISAAISGRIFSPLLPVYDAVRLVNIFWMAFVLVFLALTARELFGPEQGWLAAAILLGCVHLQFTAHKLITDVGLLAGFSAALYGLAVGRRRPGIGGLWLGTGAGIGFLCKGLFAPGVVGILAISLPILFRDWRKKEYFRMLLIAAAAILPWLLIWPTALYLRSRDLFIEWFWNQNLGRFFGFAYAKRDNHLFYAANILQLAWPVAVFALWALWHYRRSLKDHPVFQLPLTAFLVMFLVLSASAAKRGLYGIPMLLPLSLIASAGVAAIPEKAARNINKISIALFGLIALTVWVGWLSFMTGRPAFIATRLHGLYPDYSASLHIPVVVIAFAYTLAWVLCVVRFTRASAYVITNWTIGMVLTWGLVMTLWLPVVDSSESQRAIFESFHAALPDPHPSIASQGLDDSERAMLEYFAGIDTRRVEVNGLGNCDLLLVQSGSRRYAPVRGHHWEKVWEFARPINSPKEIFTLYRRHDNGV